MLVLSVFLLLCHELPGSPPGASGHGQLLWCVEYCGEHRCRPPVSALCWPVTRLGVRWSPPLPNSMHGGPVQSRPPPNEPASRQLQVWTALATVFTVLALHPRRDAGCVSSVVSCLPAAKLEAEPRGSGPTSVRCTLHAAQGSRDLHRRPQRRLRGHEAGPGDARTIQKEGR